MEGNPPPLPPLLLNSERYVYADRKEELEVIIHSRPRPPENFAGKVDLLHLLTKRRDVLVTTVVLLVEHTTRRQHWV